VDAPDASALLAVYVLEADGSIARVQTDLSGSGLSLWCDRPVSYCSVVVYCSFSNPLSR
jgi:hypothetical protein